MAYRVELTIRAKRQLNNLYVQISADDSAEAALWFNGLEQAIDTLWAISAAVSDSSRKQDAQSGVAASVIWLET
jgi:hypothetical protein